MAVILPLRDREINVDPEEHRVALEAVRTFVEDQGYEILQLTLSNDRSMSLTLDADPGPITINDCTWVNRRIREVLESSGLPVDDYAVEVQSPGVKRGLLTPRHFERFVGLRVRVKFKAPVEGVQIFFGKIVGIEGATITLLLEHDQELSFEMGEVANARLDPSY